MTFALIIPVYNASRYLRECLDSVCNQSIKDWECVCVDDGSTDGSAAILEDYAAKDNRFLVIHQQNAGVSRARNAALDKVRGEWIGFVDADDAIGVNWLKSAADAIKATRPDIVKMRLRRDNQWADYSRPQSFATYRGAGIYGWSGLRGGMTVQNFYRRGVLSGVRFPPGMRIYEDGVFNLHALVNCDLGVQVEYDGYWYRFSETSSFKKRILASEYARLITELRDWFAASKAHLDGIAATEIAASRIVHYVRRMLLQWARGVDGNGEAEAKEIALALREARDKAELDFADCGLLYGKAVSRLIARDDFKPLRKYAQVRDLVVRIRRRMARGLGL